jgi:hypothetical protein
MGLYGEEDVCEVCGEETDGRLFECSNCETIMCFNCIEVDDYCPECKCQNKIFQV